MEILQNTTLRAMVTYRRYLWRSRYSCGFNKFPLICCTTDDPRNRNQRKNLQWENKQKKDEGSVDTPWLKKLKRVFTSPPICGQQNVEDKIFGGDETKIDEFPWIVLLFYSTRKLYFFELT